MWRHGQAEAPSLVPALGISAVAEIGGLTQGGTGSLPPPGLVAKATVVGPARGSPTSSFLTSIDLAGIAPFL